MRGYRKKTCVSNLAPLWHLGRVKEKFPEIKSLELITECYETISIPSAVEEELKDNKEIVPSIVFDFKETYIKDSQLVKNENLVEDLLKKFNLGRGEIETYVLYLELETDEALLANRGAEDLFSYKNAKFTEITNLGKVALENNIIDEKEYNAYIKGLFEIGYIRKEYLELYKSLGLLNI